MENSVETYPCYHCGLDSHNNDISLEDKVFCCVGCKTAFEILNEHDLCDYYDLNATPGSTPNEMGLNTKFGFLDDESLQNQLLSFSDGSKANVSLSVPSMHCSSCIWLLESLYKLNPCVKNSTVNYLQKTVSITYDKKETNLKSIVELLASLGYEPEFNLQQLSDDSQKSNQKSLYIKIGIAGFAFANIMLLSLPEYFARVDEVPDSFIRFFGYLNILLAIPVLFYSARDYYISAWKGLKHRVVNMDIPIALGITTLFIRSSYEIVTGLGQGWMDSFSGLVFFLLIGRIFQEKTYQRLSFERDYKSYFPISVMKKSGLDETSVPLDSIQPGDRILVRNNEVIPGDSILINGDGNIDYSFVTGEIDPSQKESGDLVYAGGKQVGSTIELEVVKPISQSYLTQLWNNDVFQKEPFDGIETIANTVAKYFTLAVATIALGTFLFWYSADGLQSALNAATAVLIIACPCALALTIPFTFGTLMRFFGRETFYIKNTHVVEKISRINTIVFDKTGTMTDTNKMQVNFFSAGEEDLSEEDQRRIRALSAQSTHPLSRKLTSELPVTLPYPDISALIEKAGKGIEGKIDGIDIKLGSSRYIRGESDKYDHTKNATRVYVAMNGIYRGYYEFRGQYRRGLRDVMGRLAKHFELDLLSGDNDHEKEFLLPYFRKNSVLKFNQTPEDKLNHIQSLQDRGDMVMMVGDGMNDAGALKQSDVGLSISEDVHAFSPACDCILDANNFYKLPKIIEISKTGITIVKAGFVISFLYNAVGLTLAVQGILSPLISAVLMPISSVTVVAFSTISSTIAANRKLAYKDIKS